ncbi:MAG: endolytic transglycosylase MltG [Anaerolineales bacterium]|nr:endolytic transglycosylase MltG [Anaerolineales bacterium]
MRLREKRRKANRLFVYLAVTAVVGAVAVCAISGWAGLTARNPVLGDPAPELNLLERAYYTTYLNLNGDVLTAPAGADPEPRSFNIALGESVASVGERLQADGLVRDQAVLDAYLRYTGWDQHIEAGDFILRQTMNLTEVARALTDARAREVMARIYEGWRREQIAESLAANPTLSVDPAEFLALTGPGAIPPGTYAFLADRPPSASLEGFLFPDSYLLRPGATAQDLVRRLLDNFALQLSSQNQAAYEARGITIYEAVTIASLIEREAVKDEERPLIASVIFNRLEVGQMLEIDATVQFAIGTSANWWPPLGGLDLRNQPSPFNTYTVVGLPAGPISNVRRASLDAVAFPAQTPYLYYQARCDGSGFHNFATTYEEHVANLCP